MKKERIFDELISRNILTLKDNHLILLNKIDIGMYDSSGWVENLQRIGKEKGEKYLFSLGYLMGEDTAKDFLQIIKKENKFLPKELSNLTTIIEITGFGVLEIEEKQKKISVEVIHNHIIEMSKAKYSDKTFVYSFYAGVYSGFISVFKNKKLKLKLKSDSPLIYIS